MQVTGAGSSYVSPNANFNPLSNTGNVGGTTSTNDTTQAQLDDNAKKQRAASAQQANENRIYQLGSTGNVTAFRGNHINQTV